MGGMTARFKLYGRNIYKTGRQTDFEIFTSIVQFGRQTGRKASRQEYTQTYSRNIDGQTDRQRQTERQTIRKADRL